MTRETQSANEPVKVLTIAGSDSGGAAGLQADLKTFTLLGAYGMNVITVVTAQNSTSVDAVYPLPEAFVAAQLDAVLADYGTAAVKTGFIGDAGLISLIAAKIRQYELNNIVIDPVLVDHRSQSMFPPSVTRAYLEHLFPLADLVTPNLHEAALLSDRTLPAEPGRLWMEAIAGRLHLLGARSILIKGGHSGNDMLDLFFDGDFFLPLATPWIKSENTHGSGDTLSAAICAYLAQGLAMKEAIILAREYTIAAIESAAGWHLGRGHGPVANLSTFDPSI